MNLLKDQLSLSEMRNLDSLLYLLSKYLISWNLKSISYHPASTIILCSRHWSGQASHLRKRTFGSNVNSKGKKTGRLLINCRSVNRRLATRIGEPRPRPTSLESLENRCLPLRKNKHRLIKSNPREVVVPKATDFSIFVTQRDLEFASVKHSVNTVFSVPKPASNSKLVQNGSWSV